jgi:hypothetical protein
VLRHFETYLARLDDYALLNPKDKKLYERYVANPASFSLTQMNDAATRRDVKITRFKEEKELKQRLEVEFLPLESSGRRLRFYEVPLREPAPAPK